MTRWSGTARELLLVRHTAGDAVTPASFARADDLNDGDVGDHEAGGDRIGPLTSGDCRRVAIW